MGSNGVKPAVRRLFWDTGGRLLVAQSQYRRGFAAIVEARTTRRPAETDKKVMFASGF
ncbi:hypothetical protein [Burkholderia ambifaria]|uniref:hypothetical protein n=1 Tax=Burkholderia ambifaria TaxID=152480 RepID=UPI002FE2EB10